MCLILDHVSLYRLSIKNPDVEILQIPYNFFLNVQIYIVSERHFSALLVYLCLSLCAVSLEVHVSLQ